MARVAPRRSLRDRLTRQNVLATSGRAVEAAGDVDVLLLDKTGTITLGNRQASEFIAAPGVDDRELADAAQLSSLADETPEGRSVVVLAKQLFDIRGRELTAAHTIFIPFTAETRMSGVDLVAETGSRVIRKGAAEAVKRYVESLGGNMPADHDQRLACVFERDAPLGALFGLHRVERGRLGRAGDVAEVLRGIKLHFVERQERRRHAHSANFWSVVP